MKIIDGNAIAAKIREELKKELIDKKLYAGLAVVMVGNDGGSAAYVRNKIKDCEEIGIKSFSHNLPENAPQNQVEELVKSLAADKKISGLIVQLPLPKHLDEKRIIKLIPPEKDVDCFNAMNVGNMFLGNDSLVSCTPYGIIKMLEHESIKIEGKHAVVLGRSNIVGKPMAMLLLQKNATVTVCHSKTENLKDFTNKADILIAAIGKPGFVTADMVKKGAVVIDVGTSRVDGKLKGDVDFAAVSKKASYISPVPGGVGPLTRAMLMYNTVLAAAREVKSNK